MGCRCGALPILSGAAFEGTRGDRLRFLPVASEPRPLSPRRGSYPSGAACSSPIPAARSPRRSAPYATSSRAVAGRWATSAASAGSAIFIRLQLIAYAWRRWRGSSPIQCGMAHAHQSCLLAQLEHLREQPASADRCRFQRPLIVRKSGLCRAVTAMNPLALTRRRDPSRRVEPLAVLIQRRAVIIVDHPRKSAVFCVGLQDGGVIQRVSEPCPARSGQSSSGTIPAPKAATPTADRRPVLIVSHGPKNLVHRSVHKWHGYSDRLLARIIHEASVAARMRALVRNCEQDMRGSALAKMKLRPVPLFSKSCESRANVEIRFTRNAFAQA